jgi:hypothetical protein
LLLTDCCEQDGDKTTDIEWQYIQQVITQEQHQLDSQLRQLIYLSMLYGVGARLPFYTAKTLAGLIQALTVDINDLATTRFGIAAFGAVAPEITDDTIVSGLCETIVNVLLRHGDDHDIACLGCNAISTLTLHDTDNRVKLGKAGACEAVVHVLEEQRVNASISRSACAAICSLAHDNTDNSINLGKAGACEVLSYVATAHSGNYELQHVASTVAAMIAREVKGM